MTNQIIEAINYRSEVLGYDDPFSDTSNMGRLVRLYGHAFRYDTSSKTWLIWDGRRWLKDNRVVIENWAKRTIRHMYYEAYMEESKAQRTAIGAAALKSESAGRIKAMVELCKSEETIAVNANDLDRGDWLLNCDNCTVDLNVHNWNEDGCPSVYEHNPADLITKCIPIAYDPAAECPVWCNFLMDVMNDDVELVHFLQRAIAYSLTGSDREQCLFFLWGTGSNGKSTFINTLRDLFGDYGKNTQPDAFMRKGGDSVRDDIARLRGARLVTATETDEGQRMAENLIKQLTGGDVMTARHLYGEHFEFKPTFKIWIAGNHKPVIKGSDHGVWRRIMLIPFIIKIEGHKKDKDLPLKLKDEMPGILNWALEGLKMWVEFGIDPPTKVMDATKAYRDEMDHLGTFIAEVMAQNKGARALIGDTYIEYEKWCDANGEYAMSKRDLTRKMQERGFTKVKSGGWFWQDIEILTNSQKP